MKLRSDMEYLVGLLSAGVSARAWPGCVLGAYSRSGSRFLLACGAHMYSGARAVRSADVFDLASLTKVVGTTSVIMDLVGAACLDLDRPLAEVLPDFVERVPSQASWRRRVSARHLLAHASGLPAYRPFHRQRRDGPVGMADYVLSVALESEPAQKTVYSDIGFMLLGLLAERISGTGLAQLVERTLCGPLGLKQTRFFPPSSWMPRILPTESKPGMAGFVHGVVHDENARFFGGVSGHAGLFSCAQDLGRFAQMMLCGGIFSGVTVVTPSTFREFTRVAGVVAGSTRCLGWDGVSAGCSGGDHLYTGSFGHTGFTGTSLWIDPEADLAVVLLTNAVHPRRECRRENGFFECRRAVHTAVYEVLGLA